MRDRPNSRRHASRPAFTLLEVLIATAVTMVMMLGLAQIFKVLGDGITKGRAGLELNNRLRNVMHRVRTDLDNVTVDPRPPVVMGTGRGYIKYYEGPLSDLSFANNTLVNRFGDTDDIFMATVKADGPWFTGKVPRFIANQTAPVVTDGNGNGIADCYDDLVTISSQYAEIVMFAQPLPQSTAAHPNRNPITLAENPSLFEDNFPTGNASTATPTAAGDGIPDAFRLHYRVLLIRPDLNLPSGYLPANAANNVMVAGAQAINSTNLPTPTCDMYNVHQYCDLSVRRVYDPADGAVGPTGQAMDYVAANSLEDLADPANRFAHVIYNYPNYQTMPALALGPSLASQQIRFADAPLVPLQPKATNQAGEGGGYLHPAFSLMGARTGEDLMVSDLLAFDLRAFDPSAPVILDSTSGLTLRPFDPGFASVGLRGLTTSPATSRVEAAGEFVDLNWAGMLLANDSTDITAYGTWFNGQNPKPINVLTSPLSGILYNSVTNGFVVEDSLYQSGAFNRNAISNGRPILHQPCFDSFTTEFERDGVLHAELASARGLVRVTGNVMLAHTWRAGNPDAGVNGVDDQPNGTVDEPGELETRPPFPIDLRGLQISVRLEDRQTKQFNQMSTVKEFVTK